MSYVNEQVKAKACSHFAYIVLSNLITGYVFARCADNLNVEQRKL